jgi:hypothetical protein
MSASSHGLKGFIRDHIHVVLYSYFWLGLFICGLAAPQERVAQLGSGVIQRGWHLSLLSMVLLLPVPIIYFFRMKRAGNKGNGGEGPLPGVG